MSTKTRQPNHAGHLGSAATREWLAENTPPFVCSAGEEQRLHSIRVRAYDLWEQAGKPDGDADRERFWSEAESEIRKPPARG
ncbi:DUF2934 domain-containing protein [Fimbriiglobus ruber]|uniref:DUF2934 domain-containing protein n=1 Tax=Fimbriiglobus ruber TaxID=1908690 RepID=A0A225DFR9_9BACT|nr:DUF2934 domain-containing protein [Fimbriiglobus ruber]OWK39813.1 hypothetical protein FRUB_05703 [Fimbriiglobus ruber]